MAASAIVEEMKITPEPTTQPTGQEDTATPQQSSASTPDNDTLDSTSPRDARYQVAGEATLRSSPQPAAPLATHSATRPDSNPRLVTTNHIQTGQWKQIRYTLSMDAIASDCLNTPEVLQGLKRLAEDSSSHDDKQLYAIVCTIIAELKKLHYGKASPSADPRERYKSFLENLRMAINKVNQLESSPDIHQSALTVLQAIARSFFTGITDTTFHRDLVHATRLQADPTKNFLSVQNSGGPELAKRLNQSQDLIYSQAEVLENADNPFTHFRNVFGGIFGGELGLHYDPYMQGNTPYSLFELSTSQQNATCIRMGTTTMQDSPLTPSVTPEFRQFISGLKEGEHHLYINRQKRSSVEGGRSYVLELVQEEEALQNALTVVTLPADGSLYNQSNQYEEDCDFPAFKAHIIHAMTENHEGFYFPHSLRERFGATSGFTAALNAALDLTHEELELRDEIPFNQNQRRAILFHFLNYTLVGLLLDTVHATTYNNTCKDDIDRGGMANAYMYALTHRPGPDASANALENYARNLEGVTFAPAMIVKKRGVIAHRFHDLTNALTSLDIWSSSAL
jgi:hypothetical protein